MAMTPIYLLATAIGVMILSACAGEPDRTISPTAPTSVPPLATGAAQLEPIATFARPVRTIAMPTPAATAPFKAPIQATGQPPQTGSSGATFPPKPDATPTYVPFLPSATPTALPIAAPAVQPTETPTPGPTPGPTAVVEPCRAPSESPIVPGPSEPSEPHDRDSVFRSLTVEPNDPDIVILGTDRNGMVKSTDGGQTWTRLRAGLRASDQGYSEVWDIDISASNPDVIMAATLDSPGPPSGTRVAAGLYRSEDGGETWIQLNCGFTTSRVVSIRIDPSDPEAAVVGLEGGFPSYTGDSNYYPGGIFRTEDAGENWDRLELGPATTATGSS